MTNYRIESRINSGPAAIGALARVLAIAIGTLCGLAIIPADAAPAGRLELSATVLATGLLIVPFIEGALVGVKPALRIRNLLLVGLVYWLMADLIQGLYAIEASQEAIEYAFILTGVFGVGIALGGGVRPPGLPVGLRRITQLDVTDRQIMICAIFCFVIGDFYYVYRANFSPALIIDGLLYRDRWSAPWARDALGNWDSFIEQLSYFGYLLPLFTALLYVRSRTFLSAKTAASALLSAGFLAFIIQGGGRTSVGAILGAAIMVGILMTRRPIRPLHLTLVLAIVFAVQVGMNIIVANRGTGFGNVFLPDWSLARVRVDDNFNRLAQTIDFVPRAYPYSGLEFAYFGLVRPIPRVLWPGKPISAGFSVADALGEQETTLTTSVVGEAYAGYGLPLVLATGIFFGAAARWWERTLDGRVTSGAVILYAFGAMALFTGLRGFVNIVLMSYPILSFWLLATIFWIGKSTVTTRVRKIG